MKRPSTVTMTVRTKGLSNPEVLLETVATQLSCVLHDCTYCIPATRLETTQKVAHSAFLEWFVGNGAQLVNCRISQTFTW